MTQYRLYESDSRICSRFVNPKSVPSVFGTLLWVINHGSALVQGKMTRSRWVSVTLTYFLPYAVNILWTVNQRKAQ